MTRTRLTTLLLALLSLFAVGACGDDGDRNPEATPAEDSSAFASGDFGDIPIHPLAEEAGEKTQTDDVVAQSFRARNLSQEQLFAWYDENLTGWQQESPPKPLGEAPNASWRARWIRGDQRLIVTASAAPTLESPEGTDDPVLQYSLSLEPQDRPIPE